ncbi:MAG: tetratricopeptide repeat protein [Gemmatimonadota bacterium]
MRRLVLLLSLASTAMPAPAQSPAAARVAGWRSDIDSLTERVVHGHPNPWAHLARAQFLAESNALRDSAAVLGDARLLAGIMRLAASLGDGHTGVTDLGRVGTEWFPLRLAHFADGLWVTAITPQHRSVAGARVVAVGGIPTQTLVSRWLQLAPGDNEFNRRSHSAMLANAAVLHAIGATPHSDTLRLDVEMIDGRRDSVVLTSAARAASLDFEQWGEMFAPSMIEVTTPFALAPDAVLAAERSAALPLHLRDRRPYGWTYLPQSRTVYFQYNNVVAQSRRVVTSMLDTWASALAFADSQRADRLVLDLRYNSGGDGSLNPAFMRQLIKRESLTQPGRFFVLTSGKTFSAAADLVIELMKYTQPILVGEPPGVGLNASGDAEHIVLPFSRIGIAVSTRYTQLAADGDTSGVIPVNVPAPMRGADWVRGADPALDAILSAPSPFPNMVRTLRDSGGPAARSFWNSLRTRYGSLTWWEPWRAQELNHVSFALLEKGKTADAIEGFIINTERNPLMWQTWDSLGEGYLKAGRKEEALASYLRALQLAPHNWNASEQRRIVDTIRAGQNH